MSKEEIEEDIEKVYKDLGYQSQSDFFDKRLPIYNDFLSFEDYQKQLQNKEVPIEIVEDMGDSEIKFTEDIVEFDYNPNMFYANLAKDAYKPVSERKNFLNYKYLEDESSENLATYINDEKKELSFAIPGTSNAGDLLMDAAIAIGSTYPLLSLDTRYAQINNKIKEVKNKYNDYSVSVSGHSAGGSLANYLGVDNPDYAVNTYNMAQGLPFLTNNIKCKLGNCENINNFRIIGDWASSMSTLMTPGKVFNMKPIIPTDEMNLQAESQETFYYPTYMGIPHNINQFIDRNESQLLPDYGQYGRKLSAGVGGLISAVSLPIVTKKLGNIVDMKMEPLKQGIRERVEYFSPSVFDEASLSNFQYDLTNAGFLQGENYIDPERIIKSLPSLLQDTLDERLQKIRNDEALGRLKQESYLPSIKSKLDYITQTNDVVTGLAGFGLGELAGTLLYESVLKPDVSPLKKTITRETSGLDENKYFTNSVLGAGLIGGGALIAGINYMENILSTQMPRAQMPPAQMPPAQMPGEFIDDGNDMVTGTFAYMSPANMVDSGLSGDILSNDYAYISPENFPNY